MVRASGGRTDNIDRVLDGREALADAERDALGSLPPRLSPLPLSEEEEEEREREEEEEEDEEVRPPPRKRRAVGSRELRGLR
jgi:hypothetical protein